MTSATGLGRSVTHGSRLEYRRFSQGKVKAEGGAAARLIFRLNPAMLGFDKAFYNRKAQSQCRRSMRPAPDKTCRIFWGRLRRECPGL